MTLTVRIQHRGGPYHAYVKETVGEVVSKVSALKEKGDEVDVTVWKGKTIEIYESDPFETDEYA